MEELDEVCWALTTVQSLAEEDDTGSLSQRFAKWRGLVDERRARMATLYPDALSTGQSGRHARMGLCCGDGGILHPTAADKNVVKRI